MIIDMEQVAVGWGIPSTDYWSMTFGEIMVQIVANKQRMEIERKEKAMFDYQQAQLMMYAFNDPKKFPKATDVYSFLGEKEKQESDKGSKILADNEIKPYRAEEDKAWFMQMAEAVKAHNKKKEMEVE